MNRKLMILAALAMSAALAMCYPDSYAGATEGNGHYKCHADRLEVFVQVPLSTLTPNFDSADFYTVEGGTHLAHLERNVPGTIGTSFYVPVGTDAVWGVYQGPGSAAQGQVPIIITGDVPECVPPTTSPSTTTLPPSASTTPGSSTTVHTPPSTAPPATSPRTLPPTGAGDAIPVVILGGLIFFGAGVVAVVVTRRRKP